MILFLFIIMMLRVETAEEQLFPARQMWPAVGVAAGYLIVGALLAAHDPAAGAVLSPAQTEPAVFGAYVFRKTWLAVEVTSLLLLVALIGALFIGKRPTHESED
jgi:NADH-quinone oxidoreductase subunit J